MEKPWKVVAAFLGVFIAGAIFGGFFAVGIGARWLHEAGGPAALRWRGAFGGRGPGNHPLLQMAQNWQSPQLLRRYAERLDLTPEQKQRIIPLIQRASADYGHLRQDTFRQTALILRRLQEDIGRELTPEQRVKLEEIEKNQREMMHRFEQWRAEERKAFSGDRGPHAALPEGAGGAAKPAEPTNPASTTPSATDSTEKPTPPPPAEKQQ